jgi:hypothetical protein
MQNRQVAIRPHAAKLRAEGNSLCAQCPLPEKFDFPAHYNHLPSSIPADD